MANVIRVARLEELLNEAEKRGARFAWIEAQTLMLGAELGAADIIVDMGAEALLLSRDMPKKSIGPDAASPGRSRLAQRAAQQPRQDDPFVPADGGTPVSLPAAFELQAFKGRQTGFYRLTLEDQVYAARSQKELLLTGLSAIERACPGTLLKLGQDKTRTKRVASMRRESLNDDPRLAARFSQQIEGGWWVFTNNSFAETEKFVRRAAFHAGLRVQIEKLA